MNQREVVELMESSNTESEWNSNCGKVKSACDGYPDFWYSAIIQAGVLAKTCKKWGGEDQIRINYSVGHRQE